MRSLITYGSQYGSTRRYAELFAELSGFPLLPYSEVQTMAEFECVIHFGALYAGGVMGLKHIVPLLSGQAELIVVTVGLADVHDTENTNHIKCSVQRQIPKNVWNNTKIYHLRGAIDYDNLTIRHRTMMALLYAKAKRLPEEKKNAETKAMIETYGKQISFVDNGELHKLADSILYPGNEAIHTP